MIALNKNRKKNSRKAINVRGMVYVGSLENMHWSQCTSTNDNPCPNKSARSFEGIVYFEAAFVRLFHTGFTKLPVNKWRMFQRTREGSFLLVARVAVFFGGRWKRRVTKPTWRRNVTRFFWIRRVFVRWKQNMSCCVLILEEVRIIRANLWFTFRCLWNVTFYT